MESGSKIIQGAKEALAIATGEMNPDTYAVHVPETMDVTRHSLLLSHVFEYKECRVMSVFFNVLYNHIHQKLID